MKQTIAEPELLAEIEAFIEAGKIKPNVFGNFLNRDISLVAALAKGRHLRAKTRAKVTKRFNDEVERMRAAVAAVDAVRAKRNGKTPT